MKHRIFLLFLLSSFAGFAQERTKTYVSVFVPYSVTYNGSDNPNECWESVSHGVLINDGKAQHFFYLPFEVIEPIQLQAGNNELIFEVVFSDEPRDNSGLDGSVVRITQNGAVLYGDH
jgi:hypothetical protein